ncbi:MAG: hypothetical protein M0Q91_07775 [Methanoregula sp.]|nr:hypothetical protein [Methanoregula sp.]
MSHDSDSWILPKEAPCIKPEKEYEFQILPGVYRLKNKQVTPIKRQLKERIIDLTPKTCTSCKIEKPGDEFVIKRRICKLCWNEMMSKRRHDS